MVNCQGGGGDDGDDDYDHDYDYDYDHGYVHKLDFNSSDFLSKFSCRGFSMNKN